MKRMVAAFIFLLIPCQAQAYERYNHVTKYDKYFSKYCKRFFGPNFEWRLFKAQAVAESRLKAEAKSDVGAVGVMQIMPRTFEEIKHKNPSIRGNRKQPRWSIAAGVYYDRMLWKTFRAERPLQDRINFMFGAYNAGKGNIFKAQKIAKKQNMNENLWQSIEKILSHVTGKRSTETVRYVEKINAIKEVLR